MASRKQMFLALNYDASQNYKYIRNVWSRIKFSTSLEKRHSSNDGQYGPSSVVMTGDMARQ